ncbi:MAG: FecR domain-containing protein [Candidatus Rokubacteria bacterium]|nr:FecR domain-containing protein [Candidatus Rokubacteria bacterium]
MRKSPILLVAGAIALSAAGAPGRASAQNPTAAGIVTAVSGSVMVARLAAAPRPLRSGDTLYWRDVVEARKDGVARILLGGKTTVTVRELSRLELREEAQVNGVRYTVELVAGKVRASVARMLMRPGEQVEVRTRNAVASVRGTDFIVETVERPTQPGAFGLLGAREVGGGIRGDGAQSAETVVVTLSGVVEVTNRLAGTGRRVERLGAYQAVRVSGQGEPARVQVREDNLKTVLAGLTSPRAQEVRSSDAVALVASAQSAPVFERAGGDVRSPTRARATASAHGPADEDDQVTSQSSSACSTPALMGISEELVSVSRKLIPAEEN